jgi:hypothetical protein
MRTPRELYRTTPTIYKSELKHCPQCGHELVEMNYLSGLKTVQMMTQALTTAIGRSVVQTWSVPVQEALGPQRVGRGLRQKTASMATDVIGQIGWELQKGKAYFEAIHMRLRGRMPISESQVRYMYHQRYLPLLACRARGHLSDLEELGVKAGWC